jgi:hypothetical protein
MVVIIVVGRPVHGGDLAGKNVDKERGIEEDWMGE